MLHAAHLAFKEQRASAPATLCFIAAFAAMLTPLLLILGLKTGLIDGMTRRLLESPAHREVLPVGAGRYDQAFFAVVRGFAETGFVVPSTRTIAARFTYLRHPASRRLERGLALLPTAAGDPLLEAEPARAVFEVVAIARPEATAEVAALVPLATLFAVEAYLDDPAIPAAGWLAGDPAGRFATTASFRLYATGIHEVARLRERVEALGAAVRMRSDKVALVIGLDAALDKVYLVLAACGDVGFWLGLTSNLRANVERLRPALGVLALLGAPRHLRFAIPVLQSVTIAAAGLAVSFAGYRLGAGGVDALLRPSLGARDALMLLRADEILGVLGVVLTGALLAGIWAGIAAARIAPDEVLACN